MQILLHLVTLHYRKCKRASREKEADGHVRARTKDGCENNTQKGGRIAAVWEIALAKP